MMSDGWLNIRAASLGRVSVAMRNHDGAVIETTLDETQVLGVAVDLLQRLVEAKRLLEGVK